MEAWKRRVAETASRSSFEHGGKVYLAIPGHPRYSVASDGTLRVETRSGYTVYRRPSRVEKPRYPKYCIDGKHYLCHHIVMEVWGAPRPDGAALLRHLDDDPNNFDISNLAWGSGRDNWDDSIRNHYEDWIGGEYHNRQKLTPGAVLDILVKIDEGVPIRRIAPMFGVTEATIRCIRDKKSWRYVTEVLYPEHKKKMASPT